MHKRKHRRNPTVTTSTSNEGASAGLRQSECLRVLVKDFLEQYLSPIFFSVFRVTDLETEPEAKAEGTVASAQSSPACHVARHCQARQGSARASARRAPAINLASGGKIDSLLGGPLFDLRLAERDLHPGTVCKSSTEAEICLNLSF
jgi:hypothetical protein